MSENSAITTRKLTAPKYIPIEDMIHASQDNPNLSEADIAKLFGVAGSTVSRRFRAADYTPDRLKHYKKHRATIFDYLCSKILNSVTTRDIKKANLQSKMLSFAILYDKMRVETGQSTEIVDVSMQIDLYKLLKERKKQFESNESLESSKAIDIQSDRED